MSERQKPSMWGRIVQGVARRLVTRSPEAATRIAALAPADEAVVIWRSRKLYDSGREAQALAILESANASHPSSNLLYQIGFYSERSGRVDEAIRAYSLAIDSGNDEARTYYRRGKCFLDNGDMDAARRDLRMAIARDPSDARAVRRMLQSLKSDMPDWQKMNILADVVESGAASLEVLRQAADSAFRMASWRFAYTLMRCCAERTDDVRRFVKAGISAFRAGKQHEAYECWRKAVELDKRSVVRSLGVGYLLQELGYWNDAASEYKKLLENSSLNIEVEHAYGFALGRQYRWLEAIPHLRIAAQEKPQELKYWYDLAFALERAGRYDEAAKSYKLSIDSNSPYAYRLYRMIACLKANGDYTAAAAAIPSPSRPEGRDGTRLEQSVEAMERDLQQGLMACNAVACRVVGQTALDSGYVDLAIRGFEAAIERTLKHDSSLHLRHAVALKRAGLAEASVESFIRSRLFGAPYGVDVQQYVKTKAERLSATYLEFCETYPVDSSIILYESNHGEAVTCSVRPVIEAIVTENEGDRYKHVVVINDRTRVPDSLLGRANVIFVVRESDLYLKYLAIAGRLISNNTFPPYFSRRESQQYLNMWHGTPIKTLGRDITSGQMDHRNASRNFLHVTHFALPNMFTADVLLTRYDVARIFRGSVAVTGSPRMDTTLGLDSERRNQIRAALGVAEGDKLLLFAPTWRGTLADKRVDVRELEDDLAVMNVPGVHVAFRGHPLMESGIGDLETDAVIVPPNIDTNELLGAIDILVSDYSSIAIDGMANGIPTILYVYDLEEYKKDRGLYIDPNELPARVVPNRSQLAASIAALRDKGEESCASEDKHEELWRHEDGHATERVIDFFLRNDQKDVTCEFGAQGGKEVLLFEGHFIPNGVTSSAVELNRYLVECGVGVTLGVEGAKIVPFEERAAIFKDVQQKVDYLPTVGAALRTPEETWLNTVFMTKNSLWSDEQWRILLHAYRREYRRRYGAARFDTAVCFEGYTRQWVLLIAAAPEYTRKVIYLHSDMVKERNERFPYLEGIFKAYHEFDSIVSVSESVHVANVTRLRVPPSDRQKYVVAENLVSPDHIIEQSREAVNDSCVDFLDRHTGYVYCCVGRLSVEKGQSILVSAFASAKRPGDGLVLVGDGPMKGDLEAQCLALGISDDVHFTGYQRNPYSYIGRCDGLCLTSQYEGLGIVVLEAMILGKEVLTVDIPGPRDIVMKSGGVVVARTASDIALGLAKLRDEKYACKFDYGGYLRKAQEKHLDALGINSVDMKQGAVW